MTIAVSFAFFLSINYLCNLNRKCVTSIPLFPLLAYHTSIYSNRNAGFGFHVQTQFVLTNWSLAVTCCAPIVNMSSAFKRKPTRPLRPFSKPPRTLIPTDLTSALDEAKNDDAVEEIATILRSVPPSNGQLRICHQPVEPLREVHAAICARVNKHFKILYTPQKLKGVKPAAYTPVDKKMKKELKEELRQKVAMAFLREKKEKRKAEKAEKKAEEEKAKKAMARKALKELQRRGVDVADMMAKMSLTSDLRPYPIITPPRAKK